MGPGVFSLVIGLDVRLLLMEMVVLFFLGESWVHVSCPTFDWLGMVLMVFKHLLVATRVGCDTLCGLKCSLFSKLFLV